MSAIITNSSSPKNRIPYCQDEAGVSLGFTSTAALADGAPVKLNSDGTVSPISAITDKVLGIVTRGSKTGEATVHVTVQLLKAAVVIGQVDTTTVAVGNIVDASGYDTTTLLGKYKPTATNGNQLGIALEGGADGVAIKIAVL